MKKLELFILCILNFSKNFLMYFFQVLIGTNSKALNMVYVVVYGIDMFEGKLHDGYSCCGVCNIYV